VKYVGHLPEREEIYIGVELDGFGEGVRADLKITLSLTLQKM